MTGDPRSCLNWPAMLEDIAYLLGDPLPGTPARVPASQDAVAGFLDKPRGTLRNWLDGAQPGHADGELILSAWCRLGGKTRDLAPRERRPLSAGQLR